MIKDQFAAEMRQAAKNVENHSVLLVCGDGHTEVWRCTNNGSSHYGFDLVISRFGMAMYGDVDSLVFRVGYSYGIDFLARKSVCGYMISKLEAEYRDPTELDEDKLKEHLFRSGAELLRDEFVPYALDEEGENVELPEWVGLASEGEKTAEQLDELIELMREVAGDQSHLKFENFYEAAEQLIEEYAPQGLSSVEHFLSERFSDLNLGSDWYEMNTRKHSSNLIERLEMLRLCALKIQKVKESGDASEEHA